MEQVRTRVIEKFSDTFNAVAKHQAAWIEPDIQKDLGVICEDLHITTAGTHQDKLSPVFFNPLGTHNIPRLDLTDAQTRESINDITEDWDSPPPWPRTVTDQLYELIYAIEYYFREGSRVYESEYGWSNTLSHYAKWVECGGITPQLVAEEFDRPIWGSRGSTPYLGYVARNQLNMPHTLLATLTRSEANEKLSRSEALTILTVMLTRLKSDDFPNHSVIPIMLISVFAGFQVRVLEAHYDFRGLVIRKSKFLSFANRDAAIPNMDILMSFMCSKMIGNTKNLRVLTKPGAVVPEPSGHISYRDNRGRFPGSEKIADLWRAARAPFRPPNTAPQDVADTSSEGTLTSGKRRAR
ncbi:hypothetical protein AtubIFM56815_010697 [Aspergillus tubingensis]|uniref:Uncharacterized protein n=1 Tax=Aspergillus tubingensis TaxID=5068 RepID=A0A8H3SMK6_ASPTU|nr:dihydrodipicolinate synthetase family protein [Aspergillus tubingensis]GFN12432.1 dihydrodipicolinate synthetase family protein [Aspergillus tubingensis]GLA86432.1 hypothetical protein AtubIFM56815_010697 [Aspergillus tubingensis]GLB19863.1 hypothetical protein AtubIFM61612_009785 [Aspergillus tubingensis]